MTDPEYNPCMCVCTRCGRCIDNHCTCTGTGDLAAAFRKPGVHVIPNAGTLVIERDPQDDTDGPGIAKAAVRMVKGTLLIDSTTATLVADDGTARVLADSFQGLAFIKSQAGLPLTPEEQAAVDQLEDEEDED